MANIVPANPIELERKLAETNVFQALGHLKRVKKKSQYGEIYLHLKFIRTFVECAAKRCFEFNSLPNVLRLIKNVGVLVQKLPLPSPREENVVRLSRAAAKVLNMLNHLQPEVEQVYFLMSKKSPVYQVHTCPRHYANSAGLNEGIRDDMLFKFVSFIRENMKLLIQKRTDLLDSLKNEIEIVHRSLIYIDGILEVTSKICPGHERRDELFRHFKAIADTAAYLSYCCLTDKMNEFRAQWLVLLYSNLTVSIEPSKLEIRELYIQVLKISRPGSGSQQGYHYPSTYSTKNFVNVLVHLTETIIRSNCGCAMYMKDRLDFLLVELKSLVYMSDGIEGYGLKDSEFNIAVEAGCFLFSNYSKEMNDEELRNMQIALARLLKNIRLHKIHVRKVNVDAQYKIFPPHFPRTDDLGFFDSFLERLKEMLDSSSGRCAFLNVHFELIQRDLAALRNILSEISDIKHQHEQVENIWNQIMHVAYEAEYAVDSVLLSDATLLHHKLWISDIVGKIKWVKAETNSIQYYDMADVKEDNHEMEKGEEHLLIANDISDEDTEVNSMKEDNQKVCFDEEKTLVQSLLADSKGREIVFITGMAGQGKSTLANKIFHDLSMKNYFDVCARCTISQVYDRRSILIRLIKKANGSEDDDGDVSSKSYDDLIELLNQRLQMRRYLIFVDDIWEIRAWNDLKKSFPESAGSKILFTTRIKELPSKVNGSSKVIQLQPLCPKKSLELLNKKLFGDETCPSNLKGIRNEITNKCNGLPLAIEVVAGILKGNNKLRLWNEVAKSQNSYILNGCKGVLELSYKNLPNNLKPCFLYFGAFPEDEVMASKKLVRLWFAEGFIKCTSQKSLEDIGDDYLEGLISRNLIKVTKRRSCGGIKEVSIHDLVREYCLDKSKDDKFLRLLDTSFNNSSAKHTSHMDRRLAMNFEQRDTNWSKSSGPVLRTLLFSDPGRVGKIQLTDVTSICRGFKLLRVLDLMCINLEGDLPSEVYNLAHLRYLAVCGAFDQFSESISKLSNLETLLVKTRRKHVGVGFPRSLLSLVKLRHLHISNWFVLNREITLFKLLEKLENMETISTALLPYECFPEEGMKMSPKLKKLKYVFSESGCLSGQSGKLPVLDFLTQLESLNVSYRCDGEMKRSFDISFPKCIKKLTLSGFHLPWKKMAVLEELSNLEVLKLLRKAFEGRKWNVKDEMFPKVLEVRRPGY